MLAKILFVVKGELIDDALDDGENAILVLETEILNHLLELRLLNATIQFSRLLRTHLWFEFGLEWTCRLSQHGLDGVFLSLAHIA